MRIIEIGGPIEDGMWAYGDPYPVPRITQIAPPEWLDFPVYSQTVTMAVQTGTYLETAAHTDPSRIPIDQLPLERCYLLDTVCLWLPRGAGERIAADDLERALAESGLRFETGNGLLVGTGWDRHWHEPVFVADPPFFSAEAIDWVLDMGASLLGSDTPRFDSPGDPQNFLPTFFERDILLLAPVIQLDQVGNSKGKLVALPLRLKGACASPVRALWIEEEE